MAKKKSIVTNAMRLLNTAKVSYDVFEYEADEEMLSSNDFGMQIALLTNMSPEQTFKTLVGKGDKNGFWVCCIPVNCELDLKKAAKETRNKSFELIHVKELLALTGYKRGSVSPIGMKKKFPTLINASAGNFDKITVSGGMCGLSVCIEVSELLRVTEGNLADIVQ